TVVLNVVVPLSDPRNPFVSQERQIGRINKSFDRRSVPPDDDDRRVLITQIYSVFHHAASTLEDSEVFSGRWSKSIHSGIASTALTFLGKFAGTGSRPVLRFVRNDFDTPSC